MTLFPPRIPHPNRKIKEEHKTKKTFNLNGMHAGTPEQEQAIDERKQEGNRYKHGAVCEMLKRRGLYEVQCIRKGIRNLSNSETR